MKFTKRGNHVLVESSSKDKKTGRPNEYRITPLECPFEHDHIPHDIISQEPRVHWICSCPDFMIGRIRRGINPLTSPCKHITEFLLSDVEKLLDEDYKGDEGNKGGNL